MITVYEAHSSFDAKLIQDQLAFDDIESHIVGDLLQGGIGELQPHGLVKVLCNEADLDKARDVITTWGSKYSGEHQNQHLLKKMKSSSFTKILLIIFIPLAFVGIYVFFNIVRYFFFS